MYAQSYNRVACYQNQFEEKNPPFSWILGWQLLIMHKERNLGRRRWTNCTSLYVYLREEWLGKNVTSLLEKTFSLSLLTDLDWSVIFIEYIMYSPQCSPSSIVYLMKYLSVKFCYNVVVDPIVWSFFWTQILISLLFVIRGYNYWLKVILRMEKSHLLLTFWRKWQVRILPWTFSYNFSVLIWLWFLFVIVF